MARVLLGPGALPGGKERRPASVWFVCALFYSSMRSDGAIARIARTRHTGPPAAFFFFSFSFFGTPMQVSAAMAILANAMVGHGGVRELYNLTRAEYFIPAYHFIYLEEDYFFRSGTGGTSVRSISLCTTLQPPPPPPPPHTHTPIPLP